MTTQVWKIAPGRRARYWDDCQHSGCILLGWRKLSDYSSFRTRASLLRALGGGPGDGKGAVLSIWRFAREILPGDIVVANNGRSGIAGIGVVGSDYLSPGTSGNPNVKMLPHARLVDWVVRESVSLSPHFFGIATVHALSPNKIDQICQAYTEQRPALAKKVMELFDGTIPAELEDAETERFLKAAELRFESEAFEPESIFDAREYTFTSIVRRRGQADFRKKLLDAYSGRCAMSGYDVEDVLEAAHIVPYLGPKTNHIGNGLLLRADLHTLFDLKLIAVDTAEMRLLVARKLNGTSYERLRGRRIRLPLKPVQAPSAQALDQHKNASDYFNG